MSTPSNIEKIPLYVGTLGKYWLDPRMLVGAGQYYTSKEDLPLAEMENGMWTWTTDGVLWVRIADAWIDIFGLYQKLSERNQANGYAGIGADGKLDPSVLPALAIGSTYVRDSEAEMLDLRDLVTDDPIAVQEGDIVKRTDNGKTYILQGADESLLASWVDISSNITGIESVNSKTGAHIVLTTNDIADIATKRYVTDALIATWNAKQDALQYDAEPVAYSANHLTSGVIFEALKQIVASSWLKSFTGADIDGNNRINLDEEDEGIVDVTFLAINGVIQNPLIHYTVDENKRYIEFLDPSDIEDDYVIVLKYLSNLPVRSLVSVSVENIYDLLVGGKIKEELLPEGIGGRIIKVFNSDLLFDQNYQMQTTVAGAIAFTRNAGTEIDDNEAVTGKSTIIYMKANGINIPSFSSDFYIHAGSWINELNTWHTIYFNQQPDGKIKVIIEYQPLPA